jgi:hypothetical protein
MIASMRIAVFLLFLANLLLLRLDARLPRHAGQSRRAPRRAAVASRAGAGRRRGEPPQATNRKEEAKKPATGRNVRRCQFWSDLASADADQVERLLARTVPGLQGTRGGRSRRTAATGSIVPPLANKEEVSKKTAELQQLGVEDFFVVQASGPNQLAISLGTYRTEEAAKRGTRSLARQGCQVGKNERAHGKPALAMLEIRGPEGQAEALRSGDCRCCCRKPARPPAKPAEERRHELHCGLTGGIGSGKSTVADLFAQRGAALVDTDAIAHELTAPEGAAMAAIAALLASRVLRADGGLDRAAMRRLVFSDHGQGEARSHPASADPTAERGSLRSRHQVPRRTSCWWCPCWSNRAAIAARGSGPGRRLRRGGADFPRHGAQRSCRRRRQGDHGNAGFAGRAAGGGGRCGAQRGRAGRLAAAGRRSAPALS